MTPYLGASIAGFCAGALTGTFGSGGGMILAPLLGKVTTVQQKHLFPICVTILLPICIISLLFSNGWETFSFTEALPYLLGSCGGGVCAGIWGQRIPVLWLHRIFGLLIIWGGFRYLC